MREVRLIKASDAGKRVRQFSLSHVIPGTRLPLAAPIPLPVKLQPWIRANGVDLHWTERRVGGNLGLMKSAYELAMERLAKTSPTVTLTDEQKKELAELDSKYAAKIAERELFLKGEVAKAMEQGDFEAIAQLEKQLSSERNRFKTELEEKKDVIRNRAKPSGQG